MKPPGKRASAPVTPSVFREHKRRDATLVLLSMASASVVGYDRFLIVVPIPFP